jgi:hypothetical protein
MSSFASFIESLGPAPETAAVLDVSAQAVSNMKARDSISPAHWSRLVTLAHAKGIEGITIETFGSWYARRHARPKALAS